MIAEVIFHDVVDHPEGIDFVMIGKVLDIFQKKWLEGDDIQ
jgi:hypothetical protein